jgi:hypothetical protein
MINAGTARELVQAGPTATFTTCAAVAQHINATRCLEARIKRRRPETFCFDDGIADPSAFRVTERGESNGRRAGYLANWVLVEDREPPLGAHLGTPRLGYLHHGIYVGGGYVVHYAGYIHGLHRGPVEEIELARFKGGRSLWFASNAKSIFDRSEVVRRARSRIGESRYRLLTNNCEHFCEWCLNGEQRSYQVEAWLAWRRRAVPAPVKVVVQLLSRLGRTGSGRALAS